MGLLLKGNGDLIMIDMGKAEVLNNFFISVLTVVRLAFGKSMSPLGQVKKSWARKIYPHSRKDQVREYLNKLDIRKSMGSDGMPAWVLKGPAGIFARPLLKGCDQSRLLRTGRKQMSLLPLRRVRRKIWGTTGWSASSWSLGRWWSK